MASEYPTKKEMEARRAKDAELRSGLARPSETGAQEPRRAGAGTKPPARHANPAVVRLAERLGRDPEVLAALLPEDTLRRLASPMIEEIDGDGRIFKHDIGITPGIRPLVR